MAEMTMMKVCLYSIVTLPQGQAQGTSQMIVDGVMSK